MEQQQSLSNIVIWGGENEKKSRTPIRWTHDYVIYASYKDKLTPLQDPEVLIPVIFDMDIDELKTQELYDGVFEYSSKEMTVEMIEGMEFSEYKLYGKSIDFDAIIQRLASRGASMHKPSISIELPDRPPLVDEENLYKQRYAYKDEIIEKDRSLARIETIKTVFRTLFGLLFIGAIGTYLGMEIFIPKLKEVELLPDNFITARGNYIVYDIDGKMTVFKIADLIQDIGYDSTCTIFVPEALDVGRERKIVVDRIKNSEGKTIYVRGNRLIDFENDPTDYDYKNANPFVFDAYGEGSEADWSQFGELRKENAQKIILRGRVEIREGKYLLLLGSTRAVLGEAVEGVPPFYEGFADDISYATVLYSLKKIKAINVYGQIDRTLTKREGRNTLEKMIFVYKADYARPR